MKKVLVYLLLLVIPFSVSAKEFTQLDVTVDINSKDWYVFTRDNVKDNKQLKELNISEEYMNSTFTESDMYIDAVLFRSTSDYLEFFAFAKDVDLDKNLHEVSDKDMESLKDALVKQENATVGTIETINGYKFVYTEYTDSGLNVIDYYTVINGKGYTLKFQATQAVTENDKKEIDNIIKTVKFNNVEVATENTSSEETTKETETTKNEEDSTINYAIIGAIIGAAICAGIAIVATMNKKKSNN